MRFARLYLLAAAVAAFLIVAATALAHPDGRQAPAGSTRIADIPLAPANPEGWDQPSTADWPVVGGNYLQNRYSALTQVTTANVSRLWGRTTERFRLSNSSKVMSSPKILGMCPRLISSMSSR